MKKQLKIYLSFILILFLFVHANGQETAAPKEVGIGKASIDKIEQSDRWVDKFSNQDLVELPIGIRKTVSNIRYSIGITKATFSPEYTTLTVFCRVDIPQKDANGQPMQLFFGADDVKLSHQGGIIGDAKLVLLGNVDIPFSDKKWQLSLYGGFDMATGMTKDLTYVTIDCDGFKEMKISGAVEFSRDLILPIEATGLVDEAKTTVPKTYYNGKTKPVPNRVKGEFNFMASNWNDILVNVTLQPFVLKEKRNSKDYDGNFQFLVSNAVLDLSDLKNDPAVVFPDYYAKNGLLMPNPNAWRGVYVQTFDVGLPKEFKTSDTASKNERIHIGAQNLIIDKYGVSGTFYADNVFPLDKGITSQEKSWAYSLDHIDITIAANTFVKANLSGEILLPITKYKKPTDAKSATSTQNTTTTPVVTNPKTSQTNRAGLVYNGFISMQEQQLTVVTKDSIPFDLWKAKALLLPNSSIELKLVNGKFLPKANLNGAISFGTNKKATDNDSVQGKKTVDFKGITFQDLQLQTVSPIISVRSMGYKGTVAFGNFPVSIGNIDIKIKDNDTRIDFDLGLNLMDAGGASATARIGIKGKMYEEDFKQKSRYDGLDLSAISIDTDFSGLKIKGSLVLMESDPVYGDGFNADLLVSVKELVTVKAKAVFGRSTFRYWYFDASAKIANAAGIINGFGGGAFYKMKRTPNLINHDYSPSGLSYIPDEKTGFGLKALVSFVIGQEKVCNGDAGFEMAFNSKGGVNFMGLYGKAKIADVTIPGTESISKLMKDVMKDVTAQASFLGVTDANLKGDFVAKFLPKAKAIIPQEISSLANISAETALEFDFVNKSIHGSLDVYINTPGNFLSGVGSRGRAGWAVFHKDPQDWYLYVGTPDDRIGVKMGVAGLYLKTGAYLMAGTLLPGSLPPPAIVTQILGVDAKELDYMRDENALANGGGLAFGSSLDFDTGDLNFLIFYAHFRAGIGFDVMLKDYQEARCSNTGKQVGINGWYANGQSYAYLQGELGVNIKLSFIKLKVPIVSGGAAVLLQAKLPNPVWMQGYVAGNMNVLGGLIKGKFRFKFTVGEECVFEKASPLGGIKLITDVTPKQNSSDVDVFATPQAAFSLKVNESFVIPEDNGDQTYKVILEKFKVLDGTTEIPGVLEWNSMKDRANFISSDILPPNKSLKVHVEVSFQKLTNGVFQAIKVDGQVARETEERIFTTGGAPAHIPLTNIQYSYPVVEQKYFLEEEYPKGYIQLKRGQDYLFDDANWETKIKLVEKEQSNSMLSQFIYDKDTNEVSYDLPNISQEKDYKMSISSTPKSGSRPSTITSVNSITINNEGNDIKIAENKAEEVSKAGEIDRLSYDFKTSKYKTFISKMNSINTQNYNFGVLYSDVIYLSNTISSQEAFDLVDLQGVNYTGNIPLITGQSALNDAYYTTDIYPYLYRNYPLGGVYSIKNRDTKDLGISPSKAIPLNSYYMTSLENDVNQSWTKGNFPFKYNMPLLYKQDWVDLNNQIVNDYINGVVSNESLAKRFFNSNYSFMRYGYYEVVMKYSLSGGKKTTEYIYKFKNKNNFR